MYYYCKLDNLTMFIPSVLSKRINSCKVPVPTRKIQTLNPTMTRHNTANPGLCNTTEYIIPRLKRPKMVKAFKINPMIKAILVRLVDP